MISQTTNRRHDLDALRACAMLLGIILHASIAYNGLGWAVQDSSSSKAFVWLFSLIHGFRMQLFFLISGFFTAMLYQKRGLSPLLKQRFKRILIPLLIFTPFSYGLTEWILDTAWQTQVNYREAWETFTFHHLWFLWFLCIYIVGFALSTKLPRLQRSQTHALNHRCLIWLIPLTLIPQSFFTKAYPLIGPESSLGLIPIPEVLAYYALFYFFGALLYRNGDSAVAKHWKRQLSIALFFLFPASMVTEGLSFSHYSQLSYLSDLLQVTFTWFMVFGCMGFFRAKFQEPSARMRYLSDASYWLYISHLPLVFALQLLIRDWPISCYVKFAIVSLSSFVILLVSYRYCVRYTWVGTLLNGKMTK